MKPERLARGEELERIRSDERALTVAEEWELAQLKAEARSEQQIPESEIAAAYLRSQQERDLREAGEKVLEVAERSLVTIATEFFKSLFRRF